MSRKAWPGGLGNIILKDLKSDTLILHLKDIKRNGIDVEGSISEEQIGLSKEDYIHFVSPVMVRAKVERVNETVLAKGKTEAEYASYCSKCLSPLKGPWQEDFLIDIEILDGMDMINLGEEIRQEVILNLPMSLQCEGGCD